MSVYEAQVNLAMIKAKQSIEEDELRNEVANMKIEIQELKENNEELLQSYIDSEKHYDNLARMISKWVDVLKESGFDNLEILKQMERIGK